MPPPAADRRPRTVGGASAAGLVMPVRAAVSGVPVTGSFARPLSCSPSGVIGSGDRLLALLGVLALGDLLDELRAERGQVVGVARGHEAGVDVDLLVDPGSTGVADVGLQARPGGQRPAVDHAGLDQRPRRVADRRDWLARL